MCRGCFRQVSGTRTNENLDLGIELIRASFGKRRHPFSIDTGPNTLQPLTGRPSRLIPFEKRCPLMQLSSVLRLKV